MKVTPDLVNSKRQVMKIRLLLIEDSRLLRRKIVEMLKPYKDIEISAVSTEIENFIEAARDWQPQVILLDAESFSRKSTEMVEDMKNFLPDAGIVVMSISAGDETMIFIKAGATGFIMQDAFAKDFLVAIRTVAKGGCFLPAILARVLFAQIVANSSAKAKPPIKDSSTTTKRERVVIDLLSEGMSNKEISKSIGISTYTVKSHIHNIMEKLTLHTRLEIANHAYVPALLPAANTTPVKTGRSFS